MLKVKKKVMGLALQRVSGEGLRFDFLWELRIISFSHARDKTKIRHLSLFLKRTQNSPSFLFYLQNNLLHDSKIISGKNCSSLIKDL